MAASTIKTHVSADGKWNFRGLNAHAWTSGDNRAKQWTYWWLSIEAADLPKAEFEVRQNGVVIVHRQSLLESNELFARTGFVDDEPEEEGDLVGGAAKLDAGVYAVDLFLTISGVTHVLRGVRFEVTDRKAKRGGRQITTPLPKGKKG